MFAGKELETAVPVPHGIVVVLGVGCDFMDMLKRGMKLPVGLILKDAVRFMETEV